MTITKKKEGKETVIVVMKESVVPLSKAVHDLVGPNDELLVLIILDRETPCPSSNVAFCCIRDNNRNNCPHPCEDAYIKFLHQEISEKKEAYRQILRPFYDRCKSKGVKFQAKISAGFPPKDIILEEANNSKATWTVMDRCFARDLTFQLSGTNCNVSLVSNEDDTKENSIIMGLEPINSKAPILTKEPPSQKQPFLLPSSPISRSSSDDHESFLPSLLASQKTESDKPTTSKPFKRKSENLKEVEPSTKAGSINLCDNMPSRKSSEAGFVLGLPLELSREVIDEMIGRFTQMNIGNKAEWTTYDGYLSDQHSSRVLVKKLKGDSNDILQAEMKAASSIYHKNIMKLKGYHESESANFLVFPSAKRGTLDKYLFGSKRKQKQLTFQEKKKIAIETAEGIRYMHEECPQGPIVHGEITPCNIFLEYDFSPLISSFGQATWLQLEASSSFFNRLWPMDSSNYELMEPLKADIFSFGVLLLRMFCRKSVPQDDKILIEWARPLLIDRAFHELLDEEEMENLDVHEIYRVMAAATQCTRTRPVLRPSMSEVISILKGENFCGMQSSPSSDNSERGEAETVVNWDCCIPRALLSYHVPSSELATNVKHP